jgi:hypothetical protein
VIRGFALVLFGPVLAWAQVGADSVGVDSTAVGVDSVAVAEQPPRAPFEPDPMVWELSTFRLSRSADVGTLRFREIEDPIEPIGALTLADVLRLAPETRTRELSQGPTVETFELRGGGSGRAALVWPGVSLTVPGTKSRGSPCCTEAVPLSTVRARRPAPWW